MKLFTEQQIRKAFMDGSDFVWDDADEYNQGLNEYIKSVTPITLPTFDDIKNEADRKSDLLYKNPGKDIFIEGAAWVVVNIKEKCEA